MNKILIVVLVALIAALLIGCAAAPNDQVNMPNSSGQVAGFWLGLWHGAIAPITFVISLFSPNVTMYEIHNNGGWYNFGFLFALSAIWGGSSRAGGAAAEKARQRRRERAAEAPKDTAEGKSGPLSINGTRLRAGAARAPR